MRCEACEHENIEGARFCQGCGTLMPSESSGPDPLVGQVIGGRYRITGVLGEGGMGIVYVGEQQMGSTIRKVAVKTLHQHLSKDPSVLARFHRECGTVAQLEHPNTIKFYDFGATEDGTLYIAMEFVKGDPLSAVIEREHAIAADRTLKIMRQISGALDEAHTQGIVHRDLKPENVILTTSAGETDFVKVLDFGIAARTESTDMKREQKLTQQGMVLGTPPYMSPEQFTGKELDRRSDIYSLGVMAYEMLTGRLPFEADTPWQWATQHMTVQPAPFEATAPHAAIPEAIRRAILRALSKERDQRQATAKEFFVELSAGMAVGPTADDAPAPSIGSAGTAAMAAIPDFGAASAAIGVPVGLGMPMGAPDPMGPSGPMAAPMAMGPVVAVPPPPPIQRRGGGGAGLIIALLAIGGILLAAIGVVVVMQILPDDEEEELVLTDLGGSDSTDTETSTVSPIPETASTTASATETTSTPPILEETKPTTGTETTAGTATRTGGTTSAATGTGATTATPARTGATTATGTGTGKAPAGGDACKACVAAARAGNVSAAAAAYAKCGDPAAKTACARDTRSRAIAAADAAAKNGNCPLAKGIVASAGSMGIRVAVPAPCR
ncbi:MAG: protein kinase [Polyangiaceae bacterium]|nr:protein kinase [Polyangiaceae bacterium]